MLGFADAIIVADHNISAIIYIYYMIQISL